MFHEMIPGYPEERGLDLLQVDICSGDRQNES
jgi:hypothetical protein